MSAALLLATPLFFARAGHMGALSLGLMASQRNMGLMVAAMHAKGRTSAMAAIQA